MNIQIPGIDIEKAIKNSGSEELFIELLGDVYKIIDDKSNLIETYLAAKDLPNFTIQVHAMKTTCRMIGAIELGEDFFALEKLGKENNLEQIENLTPDVLKSLKDLKPYLNPFSTQSIDTKSEFDKDAVSAILNKLIAAIDDFDLGTAETATKELSSYSYNENLSHQMKTLDKLVSNLDYDEAKELTKQILNSLK